MEQAWRKEMEGWRCLGRSRVMHRLLLLRLLRHRYLLLLSCLRPRLPRVLSSLLLRALRSR